jgi:AraC-like DNA-binding protein
MPAHRRSEDARRALIAVRKSEGDVTMIRDERSIAQLFGDSISELTKLVQNEVDLARAEILQKLSMGTAAAKLILCGAIFLTP